MVVIGDNTTLEQRMRLEWSRRLRAQLAVLGWNTKQFRQALAEAGCEVSRQAIDQWLSGDTAPRPRHQAYIAKVTRTSANTMFSVDAVA